jgi:hypothetical protein
MNLVSRVTAGMGALVLSGLILRTFFLEEIDIWTGVWVLLYGTILAGIGFYLLGNTKEDDIDQINE